MDKAQLRDYMKSCGEWKRCSTESKAWQRAFELARTAGLGALDMDCMKCWDKVTDWMDR